MSETQHPGGLPRAAIGVIPACVVAALLLSPTLFAGFYGDDYVLWHVGRQLIEDPSTFFVGPGNFYRPANSWLFASHHLLFGTQAWGYHLGTLLMHLTCGALLGLIVSRFVASPWAVFAASTVWMCSPYAFEPVQYVNVAYNDLTVLLVWLALAAAWPGPRQPWTPGRVAVAGGLAALSIFCKESWVILPGLVVAYELFVARAGFRRTATSGLLAAIPAGVYTLAYPWVFPGRESYYDFGAWALVKIPHLWACFTMLTELEPYRPSWGAAELLATVLLIGSAAIGWKRRSALIGLGLALFFCSVVPILFIPFIPTRYTAVPLVGFLLVVTGVARAVVLWVPARGRRVALAGVAAVGLLIFGTGVLWLLGDFQDMQRLREPYSALLDEAEAFADQVPTDRPVVCVRLETVDPLHRLHSEGSLGVPKLYYQRAVTPYGLADWAQLFTFVRERRGGEILDDLSPDQVPAGPHAVVAHVPGRFILLAPRAETPKAELMAWQQAGYPVRLIGPWQRPGYPGKSTSIGVASGASAAN